MRVGGGAVGSVWEGNRIDCVDTNHRIFNVAPIYTQPCRFNGDLSAIIPTASHSIFSYCVRQMIRCWRVRSHRHSRYESFRYPRWGVLRKFGRLSPFSNGVSPALTFRPAGDPGRWSSARPSPLPESSWELESVPALKNLLRHQDVNKWLCL
jgi:hypothetical protein